MKNILIISPHPDDEAIGCGGAILNHIHEGDMVEVIFLTSGEKGGHGRSGEETAAIREQEAKDAGAILSLSNICFWKQPDGKFEATIENVKKLTGKIEAMKTDIIYVPHDEEAHPDHKAAAALVRQAVSDISAGFEVPLVWMYEVWTPIQQIDHIIDISEHVKTKKRAIQAHHSQCSVLKFDEAILGLNRYRGEMHSWPGGDYAEIFKRMIF